MHAWYVMPRLHIQNFEHVVKLLSLHQSVVVAVVTFIELGLLDFIEDGNRLTTTARALQLNRF
jgi:hypothetical protein